MTPRTDVHRPSAIDPKDYEYRWAFDTAGARGPTAARHEAALRASTTSVYREPTRCDHCGAHLRYAVLYEHTPTGELICTGITCTENTMSVPDRMTLRVQRLKSRAKLRRERRERRENAERRHPRATALLDTYARQGGTNRFVLDVARRYRRHGWLSDRQAAAVLKAVERSIPRGGGAEAADMRRRERGRDLYLEGKVRRVAEGVYEVESSAGGDEPYRVSLDPESCPCADSEKGNRCKHVYAALAAEKGTAGEPVDAGGRP